MYTASTYERTPRRHLALILSAAALAGTLAAAWGLRQVRFAPTPLDKTITLPGWPFTFRIPAGFTPADESSESDDRSPLRDALTFQNAAEDGRGRMLTFAFNTLDRGSTPRMAALQFLAEKLGTAAPIDGGASPEAIPIAGLYGCAVDVAVRAPTGRQFFRCAAASLPDGRSLLVMLAGADPLTPSDLSMHRSVCASVSFRRSPAVDESAKAEPMSGLKCAVPRDGVALAAGDAIWPTPRFTAGAESAFAWHVEVFPTFLAADRSVDRLLHDYLVMITYAVRPDIATSVSKAGERTTARAELRQQLRSMEVRFVDLGERRAALIVGYSDTANSASLGELCGKIAADMAVDAESWPFDVAAAETAAARGLEERARRGWAERVRSLDLPLMWTRELGGQYFALERVRWAGAGGKDGWLRGESRLYCNPRGNGLEGLRRWTIDPAARAFQFNEDISMRVQGRRRPIRTKLLREKPGDPLRYEIQLDDQSYQAQFDPPPNYLPDPVIELTIGDVAVRDNASPALFRVVTLSDRDLCSVYVRPAGDSVALNKDEAGAVIQIADFEPVPVIRWYGRNGVLTREEHGTQSRARRVRPQDRDESMPGWLRRYMKEIEDEGANPPLGSEADD